MKIVSEIIDANSTARSYSSAGEFIREQQLNKSMHDNDAMNEYFKQLSLKKSADLHREITDLAREIVSRLEEIESKADENFNISIRSYFIENIVVKARRLASKLS